MKKKPNIVIIMSDQQQAALRKSEGFKLDTMPFLDKLAKQGVDFAKAYTSMPACAPARVSMFTGRYPSSTHVKTNHNIKDAYYTKDLLDILKDNNYSTALCGKNHSHKTKDDFDLWYELGHSGANHEDSKSERTVQETDFDNYLSDLNNMTDTKPTPYPVECQGPYRSVSKAIDWIESLDKENPFFLWLSFAEPHNPYQVCEPYFSMFDEKDLPPVIADKAVIEQKSYKYRWIKSIWNKIMPDFDKTIPRTRLNYCGMLRLIDDQVKRFVDFLDDKKIKDNTLIIYLADHGDFVGEYGLIRKGPELPEVVSRIPLIFIGPDVNRKGKVQHIHASIVDILPTICQALDIDIPHGVQGNSLWNILKGGEDLQQNFKSAYMEHGFGGKYYDESDDLDPADEGAIKNGVSFDTLNSWTQSGTMRAVRYNEWKLIYDMNGCGQLYNLEDDPMEIDNLFGNRKYNEIQNQIMEEMLKWTIKTQDSLPYPRRRYVFKK